MAQPKRHLTPQQLQLLADGSGTLEGFVRRKGYDKPIIAHNKVATLQQQGPLGIATIVLEADQDSSEQLASLFTPRNDQAVNKAVQKLSQFSDQPTSQSLSGGLPQRQDKPQSTIDERLAAAAAAAGQSNTDSKSPVRPAAKSLQGVYFDQPNGEEAGFGALKSAAVESSRQYPADPMLSLSWLDEPQASEAYGAQQRSTAQELPEDAEKSAKPLTVLRSAVLLTIELSISANDTEVRAWHHIMCSCNIQPTSMKRSL